ncbi:MAG TPA: tail fiber domain-containing protein [Candidatus Udaeobacter sp.]
MNPRIPLKTTPPLLITLTLLCFTLLPKAQAVSPPPPGGYPNFTTAAGDHALQALTLGVGNTALGTFSLFSVTTGNFNTAVGAGSLDRNTAGSNTATGAGALLFNTTGTENTANGAFALFNNISGDDNTAVGGSALFSNNSGFTNTAIGFDALVANTNGNANTAIGFDALAINSGGSANTAVGSAALANSTGIGNTALGASAGLGVTTANNVIVIGTGGSNVVGSCFIGNIRGVATTVNDAIPVVIDSGHQLGTMSSSRRFKREIKPMDKASEAILALKPVTFHYNSDKKNTPQFGLVAEEVAEVNPDLVVRDDKGEIYTVRYDQVNAMLLNEFLKEHKKVKKLEATVAQQHKDFEAAVAELRVQIGKVSAQLELNKTAPQTVLNDR